MTDVELSNLILDRSFHFVDAGDLTMSNGCSPENFLERQKIPDTRRRLLLAVTRCPGISALWLSETVDMQII